MRIDVPREILDVQRWVCTVTSNRNVATYLKELTLRLPEPERLTFTAGDYVLLEAPAHRLRYRDFDIDAPYRESWAASGLLDLESVTREPTVRAYSLANPPRESDRAVLVVRVAPPPSSAPAASPGRVSSFIYGCKPGDEVSISGPFGDFHVTDGEHEIVFIAGGAGIAPIRSMIHDQLSGGSPRKMTFWYGCRDAQDLCYYDELEGLAETHPNFELHVALSSPRRGDRWHGHTGFIHQVAYDGYLKDHSAPQALEYYLCGPPLMSSAVVDMLERLGVDRSRIHFDDFGA
jgi:Na+-transporting NADH:ubiquinone oxidoreductase subunit F